MLMMQYVVRRERARLLSKLHTLAVRGRAEVDRSAVAESLSLQVLVRLMGISMHTTSTREGAPDTSSLPFPLVRLIFEYLPLPRLWTFEMERLLKRTRMEAYDAALHSAMTMMDEMMMDLQLPCAPDDTPLHSGWLVRLARDEVLQRVLLSGARAMPSATMEGLIREHDLQSVLLRRRCEISVVGIVADQIVSLCRELYAWYAWHECPGLYCAPNRRAPRSAGNIE